jgi:hypothetical protein
VSGATNGSTICLNSGNYGTVNLSNISRSGFVTLQSATGVDARMSPQVGNSRFIKFASMTLTNMLLNSCSTNIQILDNVFVPETPHLLFNYDTNCSGVTNMALVVDGNTFDRGRQALFEGRISVRGVNGLTISNNLISNVPSSSQSDGIQIVGGSRNVVIGPGNRFTGILVNQCAGVHCDSIQDYGGGPNNKIIGNVFENSDTFIMMPDGSSDYTIEDNVFNGTASSYQFKIQLGSAVRPIFRHNTLKNTGAAFDSKTGSSATTNALIENNIWIGSLSTIKTSGGSGCSGCTIRYNLYSGVSATGSNALTGTPVFVGGSNPGTWEAWELAAGSPGSNAGSDGQDMGIVVGSQTASAPPSAPTTLTVR